MRSSTGTRSTVSSNTITTPEPSVAPAARVASKLSSRSSASGPTKTPAAPPRRIAFSGRPPATPPAISRSSPRRIPNGASISPGRSMQPLMQKRRVPVDCSVPIFA